MFDHVKFGVNDYAASKAFFLEALEPLGIAVVSEGLPAYGAELSAPGLHPQYQANYHAACAIRPDGHNIEAVCHEPGA